MSGLLLITLGTQDGMSLGPLAITAPGIPVGIVPGIPDGTRLGITAPGMVLRCGVGAIGVTAPGITTMDGIPGMTTCVTGVAPILDIVTADEALWPIPADLMVILPMLEVVAFPIGVMS